jgi:hypothetical protein
MVSGITEDPVEPGGGGTPPASAGSLASRRPQARRPEYAQRRSPTPGTTRDEAMLEMETQIADLDGKLFASERSARRLASEVAALRLALESTEEAQEAVALDMHHIRKDLKSMMQRIDDGMKEVVEAAVAAARKTARLDAFARQPEKASPKANPRRRSESPFEPIHESDKEESGFEDSEGAGLFSGVQSAGDAEYDDSRSEIAESEQGMQIAPRVLKIDFFNSKELESRMCDMTPTDIEEKIPDLRDDLEARSNVIAEVLEMDHATYVRALAQRPEVYAADQFIRRACKSVVKSTTSEAKVFKARERTLRTKDIKAYRSGAGMLKRMLDFPTIW